MTPQAACAAVSRWLSTSPVLRMRVPMGRIRTKVGEMLVNLPDSGHTRHEDMARGRVWLALQLWCCQTPALPHAPSGSLCLCFSLRSSITLTCGLWRKRSWQRLDSHQTHFLSVGTQFSYISASWHPGKAARPVLAHGMFSMLANV